MLNILKLTLLILLIEVGNAKGLQAVVDSGA
jgi:hypothetical protein